MIVQYQVEVKFAFILGRMLIGLHFDIFLCPSVLCDKDTELGLLYRLQVDWDTRR